jgi:hypothetical protein
VKYEKQKIDINQHVIKNQQQRAPGQPDFTAMIVPDPKRPPCPRKSWGQALAELLNVYNHT